MAQLVRSIQQSWLDPMLRAKSGGVLMMTDSQPVHDTLHSKETEKLQSTVAVQQALPLKLKTAKDCYTIPFTKYATTLYTTVIVLGPKHRCLFNGSYGA